MKTIKNLCIWLLSLTWGLPMTLVGAAAALFLRWKAYIPTRFGPCWVFTVGEGWGGVNLGPVVLVSKTAKNYTIYHEIGHCLQNCVWGPLFPFVIAIPSVVRYWLREQKTFKNKVKFATTINFILLPIATLLLLMSLEIIVVPAWLLIMLGLITLYLDIIMVWLDRELRKYITPPYPSYDDIWFEGQATKWGINIMEGEE